MVRITPYTAIIAILLVASASWAVFQAPQKNIAPVVFAQGFLKNIPIPLHHYLRADIAINNYHLKADIAGTAQQQQTGLAIKSTLQENEAMLFPFATENYQAFWMKDMKFPIDIMWIDKNNTIVYVQPNLPPCISDQNCPVYQPKFKIIYVLEVVAGFAQKHRVVVGETKVDMRLTSE